METALAQAQAEADSSNVEKQEGEMISNPVVIALFNLMVRSPWKVLLATLAGCIVAASIQQPYDRLKNAPMNLKSTPNRLTSVTDALENDFGIQGTSSAADALIIWCDSPCNLTEVPAFSEALEALDSKLNSLQKSSSSCSNITWSHYKPDMSNLEKQQYLASDRTASVLLLHRNEYLEIGQISDCMLDLNKVVSDIGSRYDSINVRFGTPIATAMMSLQNEMTAVLLHVCISVPILSMLFYFYVGSCVKVVTALLTLGFTKMWVRASIVLIKQSWSNFNFSQSDTITLFIQLALALDYAVIFWGRFRQERLKRPDAEDYVDCILRTLKTSGLVIVVSVAVLEVGFSGMLFYPDLNSSGNLALIASLMFSCLSVGLHSLVIPAAMAACAPSLFDEDPSSTCCPCLFGSSRSDSSTAGQRQQPTMGERIFTRYAKVATRPPCVFLLPALAYLGMVPFLIQLSHYKPWYDIMESFMDKTLPEYTAYRVFTDRFTSKHADPVMMLIKTERLDAALLQTAAGIGEREGLSRMGRLPAAVTPAHGGATSTAALPSSLSHLAAAPIAGPGPVSFVAMDEEARVRRLGGKRRAALVSRALSNAKQHLQLPVLPDLKNFDTVTFSPEYRNLTCTLVENVIRGTKGTKHEIRSIDVQSLWWNSAEGRCSATPNPLLATISRAGHEEVMTIFPSFESFGETSQELTNFMWDKLEPMSRSTFTVGGSEYRFTAQYYSPVAVMMLGDEVLARRAPWIIACTVVCICGVVGLFFRSAGVAVKVLLSVVVPILCNYGILVSMWQNGWFAWAGIQPTGGVTVQLMFTTFGFLLGLAIDYDIVLFARVYERRLEGYDNLSAVQMALVETGPMITLAGTLMTSSFLVMCFDNLALIRMIAGLYFLGVALDTYVVRTCIAPTMLVLAGRMNYWPSKMPPETKTWKPDE